ncbi:hypothetical protein [Actinomycetospora termitidis]|uniref:VapC45 PIN like domain-containing protein n=1 Tax=Actinomycetospora termitidis TaxID=3053470 RepID=A0ABT7M1C8_9PSEU|nr:hypothetical protein [Actinomycetospora sp. Odt1-22]MDL5154450.1 hypothetical protein [Actinomycetospora sp. Odt1-22]
MPTPTPPPELPRFFIDRNIGGIKVPAGLRALGVELTTLSERYGVHEGERVTDVQWMLDAAEAGEAVLMADDAIRRKNPEERRVLRELGLRAFVVNAQAAAPEIVRRFEVSTRAIERASRRPGPFVYRLHPERIEQLRIRAD